MSKRQGWPTSRLNSAHLCLRHRLSLQGLSGQLQLRALPRCLIIQEQEEIPVVHQKGAVDARIPVAYLVIEAGPTPTAHHPSLVLDILGLFFPAARYRNTRYGKMWRALTQSMAKTGLAICWMSHSKYICTPCGGELYGWPHLQSPVQHFQCLEATFPSQR